MPTEPALSSQHVDVGLIWRRRSVQFFSMALLGRRERIRRAVARLRDSNERGNPLSTRKRAGRRQRCQSLWNRAMATSPARLTFEVEKSSRRMTASRNERLSRGGPGDEKPSIWTRPRSGSVSSVQPVEIIGKRAAADQRVVPFCVAVTAPINLSQPLLTVPATSNQTRVRWPLSYWLFSRANAATKRRALPVLS